jgi:carbamate kinase
MRSHELPLAVVALGGNALLPRGVAPTAPAQLTAIRMAAREIALALESHRIVVTHGNGPQVGLLALINESFDQAEPSSLDVLDAETEGQIGYLLEMELGNAAPQRDTVALVTRVVVDPDDPAFADPGKFIGPVYDEQEGQALAAHRGWTVKRDGERWRRVVPSPEPLRIVQLPAIRRLVDSGFVVVCAGGGGVPVIGQDGRHRGVEAVIDKDLCSARLAADLGAELLVMATDVDAVYDGYGEPGARRIDHASPALRGRDFPAGSMDPKVEAACRMVESTGGRAAIGALGDLVGLLEGSAGTQVVPEDPEGKPGAAPNTDQG